MNPMPHDQVARRLKALREARNLRQEALASSLGFGDRQTLAAIEAGTRRMSPEELVRAAQILAVDLDAFLDPYRLIGEGEFSFRAKEVDAQVLAGFQEQAGRWIATYRQLGLQAGNEPRLLGLKLELNARSSFEDAAASAEMLWKRWELGDVPADRLEGAMERELGVLVVYVDAPQGISGAAAHLPGLQTILVNRHEPPGRRSFDLAHELFHVLTWDAMPPGRVEPREVRRTKGNRVELMAENFAAALLMPAPLIRTRWTARGDEDPSTWLPAAAGELKVSVPALQWRLVNLGLLTKAAAESIQPAQGARKIEETPLLFSRPFAERIAEAVDSGRLSLRRAGGLLGLSPSDLAELCDAHGHPLSYDLRG
jgi:XRE family transcriptional regulator, fatty acid utilization regulator